MHEAHIRLHKVNSVCTPKGRVSKTQGLLRVNKAHACLEKSQVLQLLPPTPERGTTATAQLMLCILTPGWFLIYAPLPHSKLPAAEEAQFHLQPVWLIVPVTKASVAEHCVKQNCMNGWVRVDGGKKKVPESWPMHKMFGLTKPWQLPSFT